jgi:hypothetical protein
MPTGRKYTKRTASGARRYKRKDHYAVSKIQAVVRRALNKNIETKSGLQSPTDGLQINHNNFVLLGTNPLATVNGTTDEEDAIGTRIGDNINLKGMSIKFMVELNERYSDVTFRMFVVRSAKGDTPTRATMFNGISGNKMIDTLNRERFSFLATKTFKIKSNAPTASMTGVLSNNEENTLAGVGGSGIYSANGDENNNSSSRYTKIIKQWIPGTKFSRSGVIQYENASSQVKFFDYHLILYAYSNYSTNQDIWSVARLNDCVIQLYYKDA